MVIKTTADQRFRLKEKQHMIMILESQPLIFKEGTAQRITRCKRLRFASSKFGFAKLLLHRFRYRKWVLGNGIDE